LSGLVFIFCALEIVLGGTEDAGSSFNVLRSRTNFHRYRELLVQFSCFPLLDSFLAVSRTSGPVSIFCTTGLVFDGIEDVGSSFHVLRTRTCFRLYRGSRAV
jgi:hypothetical protein